MAVDREDHLIAYLRTFDEAAHVQIIRMPFVAGPVAARCRTGLFRLLRKRRAAALSMTYDPRAFAADAGHYLAQACTMREDLALRRSEGFTPPANERRAFERKPRLEIPSVADVRLAAEPLDLIDLSAGGALVRSRLRPGEPTLRRDDRRDVERIIRLRMTSGEEVEVPGSIARWRLERAGLERVYEVAYRFDESLALFLPRQLQLREHRDLVLSSNTP
jgi:hypothetical protein